MNEETIINLKNYYMRIFKTILFTITILSTLTLSAQQTNQAGVEKETTEKTYNYYLDGKPIKNSVVVETVRNQAVLLEESDKNKINQDRIMPPIAVLKTVKIDNDADNFYDEIIKFSYTTDTKTDFTLVSDKNNLMVAVEDGENVSILESMSIDINEANNNDKAYVFTMNNGGKLTLKVDSYKTMSNKESK